MANGIMGFGPIINAKEKVISEDIGIIWFLGILIDADGKKVTGLWKRGRKIAVYSVTKEHRHNKEL